MLFRSVLHALPHLVDPREPADSYHSVQGYPNNALNPAIEVGLARRCFTRARIVVVMHCQGPSTHRQTTKVAVERGDGLRFGPLRSR